MMSAVKKYQKGNFFYLSQLHHVGNAEASFIECWEHVVFLGMTDKLEFLEGDQKMNKESSLGSKKAVNKKG